MADAEKRTLPHLGDVSVAKLVTHGAVTTGFIKSQQHSVLHRAYALSVKAENTADTGISSKRPSCRAAPAVHSPQGVAN